MKFVFYSFSGFTVSKLLIIYYFMPFYFVNGGRTVKSGDSLTLFFTYPSFLLPFLPNALFLYDIWKIKTSLRVEKREKTLKGETERSASKILSPPFQHTNLWTLKNFLFSQRENFKFLYGGCIYYIAII